MADIRFEELVLLRCDFEVWPDAEDVEGAETSAEEGEGAPAPEGDGQDRFDSEYPTENLLRWKSTASREGDEYVLLMWARIEAPRLPFRMHFDVGARFVTTPEERNTAEEVRPTLIWLAYPFLRELVHNLTARSPLPPYSLPPLTRLPDPSLQAEDESDSAAQ